jgi:hypothetical protein
MVLTGDIYNGSYDTPHTVSVVEKALYGGYVISAADGTSAGPVPADRIFFVRQGGVR